LGGVKRERTKPDWFYRAGGGIRPALGQTLKWREIQARRIGKKLAMLSEPWVLELKCAFDRLKFIGYIQES